jgi:predicted N-formylglutamate amidohydrolase
MVSHSPSLLITCEHASNLIPKRYAPYFKGQHDLLASHRGWDPGALPLAKALAKELKVPLVTGEVSRLLVELNRTLNHPTLFSPFVPEEEKQDILDRYYFPYIEQVKTAIEESKKPLLHLSIHTFTPIYEGRVRQADAGILYDPKREQEKHFATLWQQALKKELPNWTIGKNTPYRGTSDALVTSLRPLFGKDYIGIELEVNQKHAPIDPLPFIRSLSVALDCYLKFV